MPPEYCGRPGTVLAFRAGAWARQCWLRGLRGGVRGGRVGCVGGILSLPEAADRCVEGILWFSDAVRQCEQGHSIIFCPLGLCLC